MTRSSVTSVTPKPRLEPVGREVQDGDVPGQPLLVRAGALLACRSGCVIFQAFARSSRPAAARMNSPATFCAPRQVCGRVPASACRGSSSSRQLRLARVRVGRRRRIGRAHAGDSTAPTPRTIARPESAQVVKRSSDTRRKSRRPRLATGSPRIVDDGSMPLNVAPDRTSSSSGRARRARRSSGASSRDLSSRPARAERCPSPTLPLGLRRRPPRFRLRVDRPVDRARDPASARALVGSGR